jgi:hypothetical protein
MKKILLTSILINACVLCFAGIKSKNIIGDWVKIKTITLDGKAAKGKLGFSNQYLRLSFTKEIMSFSNKPYDKGLYFKYDIDHDTIETPMRYAIYKLPETYYFIEKADSSDLVLKATFENKVIRYYFKNQKIFRPRLENNMYTIDNDTILIIREQVTKYLNKKYLSNAYTTLKFLYPRPLFNKNGETIFGDYLAWNLNFNNELTKNKFSKPIKVSFLIDSKRNVSNIKLLERSQEFYDNQIIKLIARTNKGWIPSIINNPNNFVKMIFTIILIDKTSN